VFRNRERLAESPAHGLALDCLAAGVEAATPARAVSRGCALESGTLRIEETTYDLSAYEEVVVLGGGKAADGLAAALEELLEGVSTDGVVVTHEQTASPDRVAVRRGGHPRPDADSRSGAAAVLERARAAGEKTLVLAAITGGGSALLCAPRDGLALDGIRAVTGSLLAAGASVDELNTVRRACSALKGGGLAAAATPATVAGVLLSDVVGDDPAIVASGPTVPRATDPAAATAVLDRYEVAAPAVRAFLSRADRSPAPDLGVDNHVLASGRDAIEAARAVAADRGYEPCVLSTRIEGEARAVGRVHAAVAAEIAATGAPVEPPAVVLSGGETTVEVTGDGTGGPNLEFAAAAGLEMPPEAVLGAVDTDGRDGSTDAAGALVDAGTVDDESAALAALAANDSHRLLRSQDALLETGPTGTNVNDLRVVVVEENTVTSETE
jgi:hydroxypyruvate reductase